MQDWVHHSDSMSWWTGGTIDVLVSKGKEHCWVRKAGKQEARDEGHVEWLSWKGEFTKTRAKFTRDKSWTGSEDWQVFQCQPWRTSYWIIECEASVAIIPKTFDLAEPKFFVTWTCLHSLSQKPLWQWPSISTLGIRSEPHPSGWCWEGWLWSSSILLPTSPTKRIFLNFYLSEVSFFPQIFNCF